MVILKVKFRPSTVQNKEGTLYYQVNYRRIVRCLSTDYHVFPQEWNEKEASVIIPEEEGHQDRKDYLQLIQFKLDGEIRQMRALIRHKNKLDTPYTIDDLIESFKQLPPYQSVFSFIQTQIAKKSQMKRIGIP